MNSFEELFSLRGHVALVTGASSGLGVECAKALALAGADVTIAARRGDRLETFAAEIVKEYGVRVLPIAADITVEADLDRIVARTVAELGEIDILINNAGVAPTGRAERISRETWQSALELDLTAPMFLSQKVAQRLIQRRKPGRIINITSVLGEGASAVYRLSPYVAAKAGLANLTRQLAVEWAQYGINVNAISPGWIPTEATEGGMSKAGNKEKMESLTPLGRLGLPEEIRGAVIFLASAAGSYVTGSVVAVDGGYTSW
jgi:NAD(P)-dependent dehydrogenase (short-subunit alcohol dehydrogenase family)